MKGVCVSLAFTFSVNEKGLEQILDRVYCLKMQGCSQVETDLTMARGNHIRTTPPGSWGELHELHEPFPRPVLINR